MARSFPCKAETANGRLRRAAAAFHCHVRERVSQAAVPQWAARRGQSQASPAGHVMREMALERGARDPADSMRQVVEWGDNP